MNLPMRALAWIVAATWDMIPARRLPDEDILAAQYVAARLWGKNRRLFAYQYWMFLTRGGLRPPLTMCFGAERIERRIEAILKKNRDWEC
jgi:hypothetical protein